MNEKSKIFELIERLKSAMKYASQRNGVNLPETVFMCGLADADEQGRKVCISDVAEALGVTKSAASQMVDKLSERGVVRRAPCEENRKIVYIEPTEKAKQNFQIERQRLEKFLSDIVAEMGGDIDELIELTEKFVNALESVLNKTSSDINNSVTAENIE